MAAFLKTFGEKLDIAFKKYGTAKKLEAVIQQYKKAPIGNRLPSKIENSWKPEEIERAKFSLLHVIYSPPALPLLFGKAWSLLAQLIAEHNVALKQIDFPQSIANTCPRKKERSSP